jgi:tRNA A-37 threonylcarbamoyl transferase component Bud32
MTGVSPDTKDKVLQSWQQLYRVLNTTGPAHECLQRWGYFVMVDRASWGDGLQALVQDPDALMAQGEMLKDGDTTTVVAVDLGGQRYVIKRYNIPNAWYALRRFFRPTRAWYCWRNAHMLRLFGIQTPRPIMMMERRWGPLRRTAYFVTEWIAGQDVQQVLSSHPVQSQVWAQLMVRFSLMFGYFRDYRIVHGDCKATNFIVADGKIYVIDLDAMRREPDDRRFLKYHARDLKRFAANWRGDKQASELLNKLVQEFNNKVNS